MEENVIDMKGLCCKIGYKFLLYDINWQVRPCERWVVFGMNGSGKTSLLSIIAGFKHYTSGELILFGESAIESDVLFIRKKIGLVSSSLMDKFYTKESAIDIILSGKTGTLGIDETIDINDRVKAQKILTEFNLDSKINYTFDMLSKGERQKVLIARALFSVPEVLILDEPCTGLDIYNREQMFKIITELAGKNNTTIIYVTHYPEEILSVFDNCLLLRNGCVFAQGKTKELFNSKTMSDFLECSVSVKQKNGKFSIDVLDINTNILKYLKESR